MISKRLEHFDLRIINALHKYSDEFGRFALFVLFFWFGVVKVFELSPAGPLVEALFNSTFLQFFGDAATFTIYFGVFEMILGIIVLIPKMERITFAVMGFHLATTVLPLFILPEITWDAFLVPSLTGQYIIKNIALLALGMLLLARVKPMTKTHSIWAQVDERN